MQGFLKLVLWVAILVGGGFAIYKGMDYVMSSGKNLYDNDAKAQKAIEDAEKLRDEGRGEEAERRLRAALEIAPTNQQVILALCETLLYLKKDSQAVGYYETVIKSNPSAELTQYMYFVAKYHIEDKDAEFRRRFMAAKEMLELFVKYEQSDPKAWLMKGEVHAKLKEMDKARAAFKKVLEIDSSSSIANVARQMAKDFGLQL